MSSEKEPPIWINYFYFGSLFSILVLLSMGSIGSREDLGGSKIFFLLYSIGEATLEVMLFIIAGWLIRRYLSKIWFSLYIGFTILCFFMHLIDFVLDRIINFSIWETLEFVSDESFDNFFHMLDASGIPLWMWGLSFLLIASIPLVGVIIYRITEWLTKKNPLGLRFEVLLQAIVCIPVALFLWDHSASRVLHREAHHAFIKSLPWKVTFFQPSTPQIELSHFLQKPPSEKTVLEKIEKFSEKPEKKPNIYLFIVESLREDILTKEIAPTLEQFGKSHLHSEMSLSNANATQMSWFSIFHSNHSYYWNTVKETGWSSGSPALQLLCKMGYEIRVYNSANLAYYGLDELIFGQNKKMASSFKTFPHTFPKEAWQSDAETLDAFAKDLAENPHYKQGQCIIFFWDSTHFNYSWPNDKPPLFSPVANEMNYFKAFQSKENIESIKNRYRNAVNYIDSLFSRFLTLVPDRDQALIAFTGDHGEEFFEHGHLFHLSQLSDVQTHVPIYLQLPQEKVAMPQLLTHMDIFPTLIDSITHAGSTMNILEGQSIFLKKRWPYAVISRYNASRTPCEICLHNGHHKIIARFENEKDIFHSRFLKILSLRTWQDKIFSNHKLDLDDWIHKEFGDAIEKLFPSLID